MIPKTIHLCWFSNDPFPVEIKICMDTWKRLLPDYTVRHWTYEDAKAIGCKFIDEALAAKKWAFASDAVRFYAVYTEGGVYMDSDIFLKRRFDEFIPEHGFATFHEVIGEQILLQAAFFMGEKGNVYCKNMVDYYMNHSFEGADDSRNQAISPVVMTIVIKDMGVEYVARDTELHLNEGITIYPNRFVMPRKKGVMSPDAVAQHRIYGGWRKRKLGRRIELFVKHVFVLTRYTLLNR